MSGRRQRHYISTKEERTWIASIEYSVNKSIYVRRAKKTDYSNQTQYKSNNVQQIKIIRKQKWKKNKTFPVINQRNLKLEDLDMAKKGKP